MAVVAPSAVVLKSGDACTIRSAEEADAADLLALRRSVRVDQPWKIVLPEEFTMTVEQQRQWIADHRDRPGWLALVAYADDGIAGVVHFENGLRSRLAHRGSLGLEVAAARRGMGVGDALLRATLDWASANPAIEKVALAVIADNAPAVALYRKHGFVEEGRRPREIRVAPGRYLDDVLMYRWVK